MKTLKNSFSKLKIKKNIYAYKHSSESHKKYLKNERLNYWIIKISQILLLVLIFGLWELLTALNVLDSFFVSSPSRIIKTTKELFATGNLLHHMWVTLYETILGFLIATVIGYIVAILLWWSDHARKILEPYIVVLNSLPKIALGPLIIIWVGSGTKAIVAMCVLICIVITTLSMLNSFINCDKNKILLLKSMNANKFQILFKLIIPNSFVDFISLLKINVGLSWVGTIMGEYLVSKAGLGYLIVYGGTVFKLDLVMTSTLLLCILAGLMYAVVALFEKRVKNYKKN